MKYITGSEYKLNKGSKLDIYRNCLQTAILETWKSPGTDTVTWSPTFYRNKKSYCIPVSERTRISLSIFFLLGLFVADTSKKGRNILNVIFYPWMLPLLISTVGVENNQISN